MSFSLPIADSSSVGDVVAVVAIAALAVAVAAVVGGDADVVGADVDGAVAVAVAVAYLAIAAEKVYPERDVPPVYVGCLAVLANANPNKAADDRTIILLNSPVNFQHCLANWYSILRIQEV